MKQLNLRRYPLFITSIVIGILTFSLVGSTFAQEDLSQPATDNRALQFNGLDQYVTFGPAPHLGADMFTLELWFMWDGGGVTVNTGVDGVVAYPLLTKGRGEGDNSLTDMNYFLGIRSSDNVLVADLEEGAGGVTPGRNHPIRGVTPIVAGEWNHAAATFDGRQWQLFLNGKMEAEIVVEQPIRSDSIQHAALATSLNSKGVPAGYFAGTLDEVRIWDKALSEQEIRANINAELIDPQPHLIGRWGLDEEAGVVMPDLAGQTADGTAVANDPAPVPGAPFDAVINVTPTAPVLVQPADTATGVATSPTLEVTVTDPEADPMTVTFYGRPLTTPNSDFALIALPDTQKYAASSSRNDIFYAQTQWVVSNKDALNIAHVMQLGDCVDSGGDTDQWDVADTAFKFLEDPTTTGLADGVPYSIAVGNKDQDPSDNPNGDSTLLYNQYFGSDRFSSRGYYGGHFGSNFDNHYELFSAAGMDFIIISLEYAGASTAVLDWVDGLLNTYSSRRAIIVTHHFINTGFDASWGGQGQDIYDALKDRPNLFLMHGGHRPGEGQRVDTYNGNTVNTLLADYQGRSNGGDGWLRILEFSPNNDEVRVKTYSPTRDEFETDSDSQFTFSYDMPGAAGFQEIGQVSGVTSGTNASVTWSGLDNLTEYEWYVTVDDGGSTTTGPTWSFTTQEQLIPVAAFSATPASGPAPLSVTFSNQTTGSYNNCAWDFDNSGSTDSSACVPPGHSYTAPGTYSVQLAVNGSYGPDALTKTDYITVYAPAVAAFSANSTEGITPHTVTFSNSSSGAYDTCSWDFGDGGSSSDCSTSVNHEYTVGGVYTVSLTVSGNGGSSTKTETNYITIHQATAVAFTGTPTSGPAPLSVNFSNQTLGAGISCTWDFGDTNTSAVCDNQSNTYNLPGLYAVSLSATGPGGADALTKTDYIQVGDPAVAAFSGTPATGIAPHEVTFSNASTGDYSSCAWVFGDSGGTSSDCGPDVKYTYSSGGVFPVSLTINGIGGESTETKAGYITIYEPPTADFIALTTVGPAPLLAQFTNLSSGDYDSCTWSFGDGGSSTDCVDPSHEYATPGTYQVSLTVTGLGGEATTTKAGYIVAGVPVTADFSGSPTGGTAALQVTFTNLATGDYDTCLWNFGDSSSSTDCANPGHIYTVAGSYTVSLMVSGAGGSQTATKVNYIMVSEAGNARFLAAPQQGIAPLAVNFNNSSLGDFDSCQWDFGDGSTLQSCGDPAHTYTTPGIYSVSLAIDGAGGPASVTYTNLITVYEAVAADFDADPQEGPIPLAVNFSNLSSGDYLTCFWDFGDGRSSSNCDDPSHLYSTGGTYTVSLQVEGPGGSDSKTTAAFVTVAAAQVSFSATPISGQLPLLVTFNNLSTGDYDSCLWDFGDGATSSECANPSHTYTAPGRYAVELSLNRPSGSDAARKFDYIVVENQLIALPLVLR